MTAVTTAVARWRQWGRQIEASGGKDVTLTLPKPITKQQSTSEGANPDNGQRTVHHGEREKTHHGKGQSRDKTPLSVYFSCCLPLRRLEPRCPFQADLWPVVHSTECLWARRTHPHTLAINHEAPPQAREFICALTLGSLTPARPPASRR